jgi:HD-GYP domain-containing protein (c-di-GMP phosphodiesterase class II)
MTTLEDLETNLIFYANTLGIESANWQRFMDTMDTLRKHHLPTYFHSLRVGWYTTYMAEDLNFDLDYRLCLFGGCGHDIGKCMIAVETIEANPYLPEHKTEMNSHPEIGYGILMENRFAGTALIAGLHHTFRDEGYGLNTEPTIGKYLTLLDNAVAVSKVVAVCDFFDALTTRKNDKGLIADLNDVDQIREVFLKYNEGRQEELDWLLTHKITAGV